METSSRSRLRSALHGPAAPFHPWRQSASHSRMHDATWTFSAAAEADEADVVQPLPQERWQKGPFCKPSN